MCERMQRGGRPLMGVLLLLCLALLPSFRCERLSARKHVFSRRLGDAPQCRTNAYVIPLGFGGLNNAKGYILSMVLLARKTGRTVLLPIVRERPHRMGHGRMMSLSEIYEAEHFCNTLRKMGVCVRCEHFPDDLLRDVGSEATFDDRYSYVLKHHGKGCPGGAHGLEHCMIEDKIPLIHGSAGLPQAWRSHALTGELSDLIVYSEETLSFFKHAFKPIDAVKQVVAKIRETFLGQPYIALHMLIEPHYEKYFKSEWSSADDIAEVLNRSSYQLQLPTTPLFIATGTPEVGLAALAKYPTGKVVYRTLISGDLEPKDYIVQAAIDHEVCSSAKAFITTTLSTFGVNIVYERAAVYSALHPEEHVLGPSYNYKKPPESQNCAKPGLRRLGVALRPSSEGPEISDDVNNTNPLDYSLRFQSCEEREQDFVTSLFDGEKVSPR